MCSENFGMIPENFLTRLYLLLLRRINPAIGYLKLTDIRPHHLNLFYDNLMMEHDIRQKPTTAHIKIDLTAFLKSRKLSQQALKKKAG